MNVQKNVVPVIPLEIKEQNEHIICSEINQFHSKIKRTEMIKHINNETGN
ncbi:hypothetical protein [Clostridium sp.]|nr:hypothetical protein [Clostridium sp.]MBS5886890.1 hypothetical protein [Clostridium sp.]